MKKVIRLIAVLALGTISVGTAANQGPSDLIQMGAYVASDHMERSEAFYTGLLGVEPSIKLENFIAYRVSGGLLAIAKRDVYAPNSSAGSGAVPYIHSTDLTAVQARIEEVTGRDAPAIIVEPGIRLLKIVDPNGQLIEFFSLTN